MKNTLSLIIILLILANAASSLQIGPLNRLPTDVGIACSSIHSPSSQASCAAGICSDGACTYVPMLTTAQGGYCSCKATTTSTSTTTIPACRNSLTHVGCDGQCANGQSCAQDASGNCQCLQSTTTTTLPSCRNSVTHVGCEGQCLRGLSCLMDVSGKCQCTKATTTTTLLTCHFNKERQGCIGSCEAGTCTYVPSLSAVGAQGSCVCKTTTTTTTTVPSCHYDSGRKGCVGTCRIGTCTLVPTLSAVGPSTCACKSATTTTSTTTTTLRTLTPLNVTFITATTLVKAVSTIPKLADTDNDQVPDITDNCPNNQNGEVFGTCTQGTGKGSSCMGDIMCGIAVPGPFGGGTPAGDCSMNQEDSDQDGAGDACDPCPHDPLDRCILCSQANPTLPAVYDWRNAAGKNYMTSVKLQNPCGSCWAHAIVGAMEADYNIANLAPSPLDLSEQYLVSDCYTGGNCGGCWPHDALPFVKTNGISDEACYPYTAQNEACNRCAGYASKLWTIDSWTLYEDKGVDFVKKLIFCNGPVGVCNSDHCVIFAGWNNTANSWIIKNSWGAGWGTNGYALKPYTGDAWWSIMKNYAFTVDGTRKK